MPGTRYYNILGLPNQSSDEEVKKKFRSLAKEFHPDKNPDPAATETFQRILDAYERILKKDFQETPKFNARANYTSSNPNVNHTDFHRKAWERYERMRKEQEYELNNFYHSLLTGKKMRFKYIVAVVSFLVLTCLTIDEFSKKIPVQDRISSYNLTRYQTVGAGYLHEVHTQKGHTLFIANYVPNAFDKQPEITLYQTKICRQNAFVSHEWAGKANPIEIHFNFYWVRGVIVAFLVLSIFIVFVRKHNVLMVLGSWLSMYVTTLILLCFLVFHLRIFSILTLGLWP
jgi:hypothetical protein